MYFELHLSQRQRFGWDSWLRLAAKNADAVVVVAVGRWSDDRVGEGECIGLPVESELGDDGAIDALGTPKVMWSNAGAVGTLDSWTSRLVAE